ncbi:hypothetical protein HZC08_00215 [Candidatus Micrarchaeota archaeon]|nr:hypothetical protein [Candidatus Micrarchaeota archaeon]
MFIARISSELPSNELLALAKENPSLLLNPNKIDSIQCIKLSEYLTINSFKNKTNIAKSFELEFLLWLSGKMDIRRAFELLSFTSNRSILIISSRGNKKSLLKLLNAKELKLNLNETSGPLLLEAISLSRI